MRKSKVRIFLLMVMLLLMGVFIPVQASSHETQITFSGEGFNPLYGELEEAEQPQVSDIEDENLGASAVPSYSSVESAGEYFRKKMISRTGSISFKITIPKYTEVDPFEEIFEKALEATASSAPNAGDYLRWHWSRYQYDVIGKQRGGKTEFQYVVKIAYLSTASQETMVTSRVKTVLSSLGISKMKNEYEIVKAIYDYVTKNVSYDYATLEDNSPGKFTAYKALIKKTAVCQGYANLIYRLMRESGIMVRLVAGSSFGESHAWNIVRINGKYYNLDSTWDAGSSPNKYEYFLISKSQFDRSHVRDAMFRTSAFNSAQPMATAAYVPASAAPVSYSIKYVLNGGINDAKNPAKYFSQTVTLADPARKGYEFAGWYKDKAMTKRITKIPKYAAQRYTLYAKWSKISVDKTTLTGYRSTGKYLYVYFKQVSGASGYRVAYSTTSDYSEKTTKFALVQRGTSRGVVKLSDAGNSNKRYYVRVRAFKLDSSGSRVYGSYSGTTSGNKISYILNGGTNNVHNVLYRYNYEVTLKSPTRKGYTFQGWYTGKSYKNKITKISKASAGNYTLYAKWRKNNN